MLEDFSGYLGTTAKTNPSRKTRRAQEREVSFGALKNTGSSREKHRACEVEPLEGGAESRPGEGCSAELSPCGPAGKPVRRYLNLPCSDSHQTKTSPAAGQHLCSVVWEAVGAVRAAVLLPSRN